MEEIEQQEEVRVAWGTGIAGHVAESGEPVNIPDAYQVNDLVDIVAFFSWLYSLIQVNCRMTDSIVILTCKRDIEQKHCYACQSRTHQVMWSALPKL